jgi:EmrB/QacA subfamily drug resistance transporter
MQPSIAARYKERYPWMVLTSTSLACLLVMINYGSLNVALPVMTQYFHAGAGTANWILLSYMLVNTVFILIFGKFADIFGKKKMYLVGCSIFTFSSFFIGFAPNIWVILILRAIQALGGAMLMTNITPIITDVFPEELLSTGLGINMLVVSAGQLLGPVVGGFLAFTLGWKWVFWFNVPLGIIGFVWGNCVLRELPIKANNENIDVFGSITVFMALGGLIVALSEVSVLGLHNWIVILGFVLFIFCMPLFIWIENHTRSSIIDFELFKDRSYTMANIAQFLNAFTRTSVVLLCGLYFQVIFKENSLNAGFKVLPMTMGLLLISPIAGRLATKYSARLLSTLGLVISTIGLIILMSTLNYNTPYWITGFSMLLVGFGSGMFLTPNTTTIMSSVPANRRGVANGLRSLLNNMGQIVSTTMSLMIITAVLPVRLKSVIYNGAAAVVSNSDLNLIISGYKWAFVAMLIATILGMIASFLRNSVDINS